MIRTEIHRGDPGYPAALEDLGKDAPDTLYCLGDPDVLSERSLGVIGARKFTPYGSSVARRFSGWAAMRGVCIVSGAAMGCDQEAHRGALESDGLTVAVLGCGADVVYPSGSQELLSAIQRSGCVVSEFPWGMRPARWTFVRRNRLIAALSDALLVVEAGLPSGTFSTAEMANDLSRPVLAVPGSIFAPECRGTNRLLHQGALIASEISDIAAVLGIETVGETHELAVSTRDRVLTAVIANPMRPDDVAVALDLDILETAMRLSELEADSRIRRYPDGRYGKADEAIRRQ
ncbi:MAG: DNA-processing protein DprA [Coriobacteriia bacterium]